MMHDRQSWIKLVVRLLQTRTQLANLWSTISQGILEDKAIEHTKITIDSHTANSAVDYNELLSNYPLVNIQDIYSAAKVAKKTWDSMMRDIAKRMKIESRIDNEGWTWFHEKLQKIETQTLDSSHDYNYITAEGLITMPIKDKDAALKKASRDYHHCTIDSKGGPSICHVTDMVRCSIVCATEEGIYNIINAMKVSTSMRILQIKNRLPFIFIYIKVLIYSP